MLKSREVRHDFIEFLRLDEGCAIVCAFHGSGLQSGWRIGPWQRDGSSPKFGECTIPIKVKNAAVPENVAAFLKSRSISMARIDPHKRPVIIAPWDKALCPIQAIPCWVQLSANSAEPTFISALAIDTADLIFVDRILDICGMIATATANECLAGVAEKAWAVITRPTKTSMGATAASGIRLYKKWIKPKIAPRNNTIPTPKA